MGEWLMDNPQFVVAAAAVLLVGAGALLALLLLSAHNTRLLSSELDDADREIAALDASVVEQAARLRLLRELHDVAVNSVSKIVRQSDGARYAVITDPSVATRAADQISDTARGALADLRRVVTVATEGEIAARTRPSLASIAELIERKRSVGLVIGFSESGERFALQEGAELAVYRIVEESLANALKHGGTGTAVTVAITWTAEGLKVLVDDDGVQADARRRGLDADGVLQQRKYTFQDDLDALTDVISGGGVEGMRQRTAVFGGVFTAYAVPGVGFSVSAIFPALRYDNGVHGVELRR